MSTRTAARVAIALAAGSLIAVAVCWGPGSRPGPAPTATEAAVSALADAPSTVPAESLAPTPTLSSAAGATAARGTTPIADGEDSVRPAATSTPFTLSDLAATSTSISAVLPPALPSVTVPPTPTPTPSPTATPAAVASPSPVSAQAASASPSPIAEQTAAPTPSPTATPGSGTALSPPTLPYGPQVVVDSTVFTVDVALTPEEKRVGLAGREGLGPTSGMLFLYETGRPYQFWMKDMLFAIDIVWIAPDCTVGDITYEMSPPRAGTPDSEVPRATPSVEAAHVLEIAAGTSRRLGLEIGDRVRFVDIPGPAGDSC